MVNQQDKIESYKAERDIIKADIALSRQHQDTLIRECLVSFANDSGDTFIPVSVFDNLTIGHRYKVNDGVYFIPLEYADNVWIFLTVIEAGYFFGIQDHDVPETCTVTDGVFMDKLSGAKYLPGEKVVWPEGKKHKPGSEEGCRVLVEFDTSNLKNS